MILIFGIYAWFRGDAPWSRRGVHLIVLAAAIGLGVRLFNELFWRTICFDREQILIHHGRWAAYPLKEMASMTLTRVNQQLGRLEFTMITRSGRVRSILVGVPVVKILSLEARLGKGFDQAEMAHGHDGDGGNE